MRSGSNRRSKSRPEGEGGHWLAALHDLRQPIQTALLLLSSAEETRNPRRVREALQLAERALVGLQAMLDDLALASRLEAGDVQLEGSCSLKEIFASVAGELAGTAGAGALVLRIEGGSGTVALAPRVARLLVLALVATALRLNAAGDIEFGAQSSGGKLTLWVEVRCAKPDAEVLDQLFIELPAIVPDKPARLYAPGLGTAARVVKLCGGRIEHRDLGERRHRIVIVLSGA